MYYIKSALFVQSHSFLQFIKTAYFMQLINFATYVMSQFNNNITYTGVHVLRVHAYAKTIARVVLLQCMKHCIDEGYNRDGSTKSKVCTYNIYATVLHDIKY
jgi:hypothetical protein